MTRYPKTRSTLASNLAIVLAVCVALALAGGWLTYTAYADPGTHTEERTVSSWASTAEFDHRATVTKQNALYDTGRTLKNRPAYFTNVSPFLNGSFSYAYDASERGSLDVATTATLVLQRVEENRDGNVTVLWETSNSLGSTEKQGLSPGDAVTVPFSFNASAMADRTEKIDENLENPPGRSRAFVAVTVDLQGTVNGQKVDRTERYRLPLQIGNTLRVDDPGEMTERHERTRTVLIANTPGALEHSGGPALLAVGLLGLLGLVVAGRRGFLTLNEREAEQLAHTADRSDFDEWISAVALPPSVEDRPVARADSLADLVDFAIDTDSAVVEDPTTGVYSVLHDDLRYVYVPPDVDREAPGPQVTWELPADGVQIDLDSIHDGGEEGGASMEHD